MNTRFAGVKLGGNADHSKYHISEHDHQGENGIQGHSLCDCTDYIIGRQLVTPAAPCVVSLRVRVVVVCGYSECISCRIVNVVQRRCDLVLSSSTAENGFHC